MHWATEGELAARKLVRLHEGARTLGMPPREFKALLDRYGVPVIEVSARRRGILLSQLDQLIALCAVRNPVPSATSEARLSA